MPNKYTFDEKNEFSKKGVKVVENYLNSLSQTKSIKNVENEKKYQYIDVDLIWKCIFNNTSYELLVEVKADSWLTGNFWLETHSNKEKGTLGCFLKTKSDFYFYYFTENDTLYILPTKASQNWFKININRFEISDTTTVDGHLNHHHTTVGRLVPINTMLKEVNDIKVIEKVTSNF